MALATAPRRRVTGSTTPRLWTPPLRELTPETSAGYSVITFATEILGVDLYPWQKWLLIHALELLDDGRSFRFRTVLVLVARQNGKSTLSQVLGLWAIYVLGIALVLSTAQDLDTAETLWDEAVDLAKDVPELADEIAHIDKTNGKKAMRLGPTPEFRHNRTWKVKAANRRAGRSSSGDLILLDELREHTSWAAWGAITHTTMARPNAQIWALSNAGDLSSIVARYLRRAAHLAGVIVGPEPAGRIDDFRVVRDPDGVWGDDALVDAPDDADIETGESSLGIFEWSAPPGASKWDRDGWAQANPSLGHGDITERTIAGFAATDPEWEFRTEVLCQWSDGALDGPFPPGSWEAGLDADSAVPDGVPVSWCVDTAWDRSWSYIAFAGRRGDGMPHVEVATRRAGTDWIAPSVAERVGARKNAAREWEKIDGAGAPMRLVLQASGAPVSSVLDELVAIAAVQPNLVVVEWSGADIAKACGQFYDAVDAVLPGPDDPPDRAPAGLRHRAQPALDVAAGTALTKPLGDAWAWNRKGSPHDVAPLVACTGALWDAMRPVEVVLPSQYEESDLMVV